MTDTRETAPASYSTAYVAKRLGVSIPTVQRWVDLGHLKAWKTVGGHRRIEAESAERFFAEHVQGLPEPEPAAAAAARAAVIVDDNPDDRDLLQALVEAAVPGVVVTLAENGFQGLVAIGRCAPDIVVTDIAMPHMNGVEMLKQLAGTPATRPRVMVAVSSRTPAQLARLGPLPPGVSFIAKPIDPRDFIKAVRDALRTEP